MVTDSDLERLLAIARQARTAYEDAHYIALEYNNITEDAYGKAEEAYAEYYAALEKAQEDE